MAGGGDADRRGSAALLAADPRGSAGRGDAESKGSCWPPRRRARQGEWWPEGETPTGVDLQLCWPPRRRARQGERRPERETPTGGESGGRRGAGGPGGRGAERGEPEGALGFAVAAASLGLGHWESGTRGPGVGESVSGGSAAGSLETLENLIYTHVFGPTCQRVCGFGY